MDVVLDNDSAKSTLEEMADTSMPPIRISGKFALELAHEFRQVSPRCGHDCMEVSIHLLHDQDLDAVLCCGLDKQLGKAIPVAIVFEDARLPIATIHDVIRSARNVWWLKSAHGRFLSQVACLASKHSKMAQDRKGRWMRIWKVADSAATHAPP